MFPALHSVKKCVAKSLLASESDGLRLQDAITSGSEYLLALGQYAFADNHCKLNSIRGKLDHSPLMFRNNQKLFLRPLI
jgi:hypothetical protein